MAINRRNLITRTVKSTDYVVLATDIPSATVTKFGYTLAGDYNEKALAKIQKACDTDTLKCVAIDSYTVREELYGMPVEVFIANAKVLTGTELAETEE